MLHISPHELFFIINNSGVNMAKVLITGDETTTRLLAAFLAGEDYDTATSPSPGAALPGLHNSTPNLVLLTGDLSDAASRSAIHEIAIDLGIPTIMYNAQATDADIIVGLQAGADDYLAGQLSLGVLLARIESVLRRANSNYRSPAKAPLVFDNLVIDELAHEVTLDGAVIDLTHKEFSLLAFMATNPGRAYTRFDIMYHVWRGEDDRSEATVTEHVRRVRAKIETDPDSPRWLVTVRGIGYRFERRGSRI
jgi:two-component system response regulator ResD